MNRCILRSLQRAGGGMGGVLLMGGLLLMAGLLAACEATPRTEPVDRGIVSVAPPEEVAAANRAAAERVTTRWLVRRVLVRRDASLQEVWDLAEEGVLPEVSRAVWNGNGLRLGALDASAFREFGEAVGTVVEVRDRQIIAREYAEVLRRSAPLAADFRADLTVPPGPMQMETFTRGRLQLLLFTAAVGDGRVDVDLVPQHHRPRASLLPRPSYEKVLDGRVFDELAVTLRLEPRQALLLGWYRPDSPKPEAAEAAGPTQEDDELEITDDHGTEAGGLFGASADDLAPAKTPADLGQGLFTTGVKDHSLQILLLLRPLPVSFSSR